ncbi:hypothetical protein RU96_GL001417 [Enterococcus canintestini]|uniref:Uncharacterized protein n=1 Tax=Enterococcus canintestini TaxID=317010 RepID=A0A1L8R2R3_9ENTE|nr:hypothetical protein RU96_GL001417 [Enterococcus canintestini]
MFTSLLGRLSPKIPRTKSITHSIKFCLPFGFNCKLRVQTKTSVKTITHVISVIKRMVPSNQMGPILKTSGFSFNISHLFSYVCSS